MNVKYFVTRQFATVFIDGKPYTISNQEAEFHDAVRCVKEHNLDGFLEIFDKIKALINYVESENVPELKVNVDDSTVSYKGKILHSSLVDRILELKRAGQPFQYMVVFLDNLMKNPNPESIRQLYDFLCHKHLPITDDGHFVAYKSVCEDYLDKYSRTISNKPGEVVEVPRDDVDPDPNAHCSYGLHVGALEYSGPDGWYHNDGDKVITVKVNPRDAVAVPRDHSAQKLRVCRYEVINDYEAPLRQPVYTGTEKDFDEFAETTSPVFIRCINDLKEGESYEFYSYPDYDYLTGIYRGKSPVGLIFERSGEFYYYKPFDVSDFTRL